MRLVATRKNVFYELCHIYSEGAFSFFTIFSFRVIQKCDQKYQRSLFFFFFIISFDKRRRYHRHKNLGITIVFKESKKKKKAILATENNFSLNPINQSYQSITFTRDRIICENVF